MRSQLDLTPDTASARRFLKETLKNIWLEQRGGAYRTVKRSAVNWAAFDFEGKGPRAVAIMLDETALFRKKGFFEAILSFEVFARLPDDSDEINEELMDEIYEDVLQVLVKAKASLNGSGFPLIGFIDPDGKAIETHDATKRVQGLVVFLQIKF